MNEPMNLPNAKLPSLSGVLSMVGLATRAGKVCSGEEAVIKGLQSGKVFLVLVAADASPATRKKFDNKCEFYEVDCIEMATKEQLGRHVGKEFRAVAAVTDENFADVIKQKYSLYINL